MWKVPRIWEGEDCIIIGGGPSLTKQFHIPDELVKEVYDGKSSPSVYSPYMTKIHSMHVIAVNMAYKIGDWMDVLFFGDVGLIEKSHTDIFSFQGLRITCGETKVDYNGRIKLIGKDKAKKLGISFNPSHVAWNFNSGAAAINLAVHFGVKRIILLGFDMKLDEGNQHWHKYYAGNPRTVHATMNTHLKGFPQIAKDLEGKVEIINACPDSRIDAFPKMNLDDIIFKKQIIQEAFVINLDHRKDRLIQFKEQYFPFLVKRFSAIKESKGIFGCNKSHIEVIKSAISYPFIVFEDDCKIIQSWDLIEKAMMQLPNDWDMLYLGASIDYPLDQYSENLFKLQFGWCNHAIIYNSKQVVDYIVSNYDPKKISIDGFYRKNVQLKFNCFLISPIAAIQRESYSDVDRKVKNDSLKLLGNFKRNAIKHF